MFTLTAKRAAKGDPIKSFTYRVSEVEKVFGITVKKGQIYVATYLDGSQVILNESRNCSTLYSGDRAKHVKFTVPKNTGDTASHVLKSLVILKVRPK